MRAMHRGMVADRRVGKSMNYRKITIGFLVTVLVSGILGVVFKESLYRFLNTESGTSAVDVERNEISADAHSRLTENNEAYRRADLLRGSVGNSPEVIALYEQALTQTTDIEERGQIKFKLASASAHSDPLVAIGLLKDIAADGSQTNLQRANAVQLLGQIYYRNTDAVALITEEIFSGVPYGDFYAEGDVSLALRRLFEHASSLYPLAISELRIARWYVDEIHKIKKDGDSELDQATLDSYIKIVDEHMTLADIDIARTENAPNAQYLVPEALARKAEVLAELSLVDAGGIVSDTEVDAAYRDAISANLLSRNDGPPRINYAVYLVRKYETRRAGEVSEILKPITSNIESYPEIVSSVLQTERENVLGLKTGFAKVAEVDPAFEALLQNLGWTDADFRTD